MPWVKLDDGFLTNPKVMRAGLDGRALYIAGLCYCAGGLTDGVIPEEAIAKLCSLSDVRKPRNAEALLVAAGLWEAVEGGYRVHDYLKYQPAAEDVRKERQRVAEWRAKRSAERVRNGVPNEVQNVSGTAPPRDDVPARPGLRNSVNGVPKEQDEPPNPPLRSGAGRRSRSSPGVDPEQRMTFPTGIQP